VLVHSLVKNLNIRRENLHNSAVLSGHFGENEIAAVA